MRKTYSNRIILNPKLDIWAELEHARTALALDRLVDVSSLIDIAELALEKADEEIEEAKCDAKIELETIDNENLSIAKDLAELTKGLDKPLKTKDDRKRLQESLTEIIRRLRVDIDIRNKERTKHK